MTGREIVDVALDDSRLPDVHRVLLHLRPHVDLATLQAVLRDGAPQGLTCTAVFDAAGRCVAVANWRLVDCTTSRRRLYVDDLVTDPAARSSGHGAALLAHLEIRGRDAGATLLDLDSGVQRHDAHRFYLRERMAITAHHFGKPLV